jgi:putative glutamine amidotransferase
MARPIIGLTCYRTAGTKTIYDGKLASLPVQYLDTVTRSGGTAVLLPPQPFDAEQARDVISRVDGLLLTGGADIDPARYGQPIDTQHEGFEALRDASEDALLAAALEADIPVLGICRGAQMLNVHLGGTLHQHLPDVVGHDRYRTPGARFHPEPVSITPGSRLADSLGRAVEINGPVEHHQAIDEVAPGLVVTARGSDGVIQAVEWPDKRFVVAVQWHPEEDASDDRLVRGFISEIERRT